MHKLKFKIALLDEFGYPISRYNLDIDGEITEEEVKNSIEKYISEITILLRAIESEGKQQSSICER